MNFSETTSSTGIGTSSFFNEEQKLSMWSKKPSKGSDVSVTEVQLTIDIA